MSLGSLLVEAWGALERHGFQPLHLPVRIWYGESGGVKGFARYPPREDGWRGASPADFFADSLALHARDARGVNDSPVSYLAIREERLPAAEDLLVALADSWLLSQSGAGASARAWYDRLEQWRIAYQEGVALLSSAAGAGEEGLPGVPAEPPPPSSGEPSLARLRAALSAAARMAGSAGGGALVPPSHHSAGAPLVGGKSGVPGSGSPLYFRSFAPEEVAEEAFLAASHYQSLLPRCEELLAPFTIFRDGFAAYVLSLTAPAEKEAVMRRASSPFPFKEAFRLGEEYFLAIGDPRRVRTELFRAGSLGSSSPPSPVTALLPRTAPRPPPRSSSSRRGGSSPSGGRPAARFVMARAGGLAGWERRGSGWEGSPLHPSPRREGFFSLPALDSR